MKDLKKVMITMVTTIITVSMLGCGSKSPTKVMQTTLDNIKAGEEKSISQIINSTSSSSDKHSESEDKMVAAIKKIDYKVNSEKIDGDNAKVNVTLNGPDLADVMSEFMQKAFSDAFSGALSGNTMTEEEKKEKYDKILGELIDNIKFEDRTMDINLTKENNEWIIKDQNEIGKLVLNIDRSATDAGNENGPVE